MAHRHSSLHGSRKHQRQKLLIQIRCMGTRKHFRRNAYWKGSIWQTQINLVAEIGIQTKNKPRLNQYFKVKLCSNPKNAAVKKIKSMFSWRAVRLFVPAILLREDHLPQQRLESRAKSQIIAILHDVRRNMRKNWSKRITAVTHPIGALNSQN